MDKKDEDKQYWIAWFKNEKKTHGASIPRYTKDEMDQLAGKYADDVLTPYLKFGDLYKNKVISVLVPLEEYVLKKCFYKRIIVLGDSFHKVCRWR